MYVDKIKELKLKAELLKETHMTKVDEEQEELAKS